MSDNVIEIRGLDKVLNKLNLVSRSFDKDVTDALELSALKGIEIIKKRTSQGKDVDGTVFTPYSISYAAYRASKGAPSGKVDLFLTGNMMSAITHTSNVSKKQVTIGFLSETEAQKAYEHHTGQRNLPERQWFALSEKETDTVINVFKGNVLKTIIRRMES